MSYYLWLKVLSIAARPLNYIQWWSVLNKNASNSPVHCILVKKYIKYDVCDQNGEHSAGLPAQQVPPDQPQSLRCGRQPAQSLRVGRSQSLRLRRRRGRV